MEIEYSGDTELLKYEPSRRKGFSPPQVDEIENNVLIKQISIRARNDKDDILQEFKQTKNIWNEKVECAIDSFQEHIPNNNEEIERKAKSYLENEKENIKKRKYIDENLY